MRKLQAGIILLVFFLFLPQAEAASGINRMLGFRGILRTSAGAAVSDGTYSFVLLIYDSESGGSCVYSARGTCGAPTAKSLSVSSGSFATVLGESSDNPITLDFNSDSYFLEVRVGGETLSPRSRLAAAPYAFTAGDLEGLTTSSFIRSNTTSTGRGHVILNANAAGSGVSSGTLFINPGSAAAGTTILGIATATSTVNLILDAEGDLSIRGNFTPTSNTVSNLGAFGAAWRDIFASTSLNVSNGSASTTVSAAGITLSGHIIPSANNASDLGGGALAFRNLYSSGTLFAGNVTSTSIGPWAHNAYDLGAYGAAWRALYVSGTSFLAQSVFSAATSSLLVSDGGTYRAGHAFYYDATSTFDIASDYGLRVNVNNTVDATATYQPAGLNIFMSYGGNRSAGTLNIRGIIATGQIDAGFDGTANVVAGGLFTGKLDDLTSAATVNLLAGVQAALAEDANANGSTVVTSSMFSGSYLPNRLVTRTDLAGMYLETLPSAGTVTNLFGVYARVNGYATNSYAGYFTGGPVWIDAGDTPDASDHGAGNTAGALFVGGITELNSNLYVDGPLQASSTVMFSGAATTTHIYPWTNNTYDLGAYGAAWRDIFASGTVSSSIFDALRFQSSATGSFFATPTDAPGNAAFVFDTTNDLTGGETANATSTALLLLRDAGVDRLSIIATSSDSVVFRSHVVSSTANKVAAFVFETSNYIGSSTNAIGGANVLFSIRNQPSPTDSGAIDPEFAVYAGGTVVADGSFVANGTPGDVAEYVEIEGEAVESGDVLITSDARNATYKKSLDAYSPMVAGVVATTPKFVIGQPNGTNAPLVLTGLADVKVADENGPIARGDLLVSSSKPGYAMRYDPAVDDGEALVGVIGTALEPLESGEGKIQAMIRSSWVNNRNATIAKLAADMMTVATAAGVELSPYRTDRRPTALERELKKAETSAWFLDDAGNFRTTGTYASLINTAKGAVPFFAVQSPKVEFMFSGSGRTNRGVDFVVFDDIQAESIESATPIKVVVTQTEAGPGVYVTDKSNSGFTVRVINDGFEEVNFDWVVIARRKGYGDVKDVTDVVDVVDVVEPIVAEDFSPPSEATSTPTESLPVVPSDAAPLVIRNLIGDPDEVATSTPEEPVL